MTDDNVLELNDPEQRDLLQAVLREGARKMPEHFSFSWIHIRSWRSSYGIPVAGWFQ